MGNLCELNHTKYDHVGMRIMQYAYYYSIHNLKQNGTNIWEVYPTLIRFPLN